MLIKILIALLVCICQSAWAATIHLNDGRSVTGNIVEENSEAVRVNVNGAIMTYFADEIKDIDGAILTKSAVVSSVKQKSLPVTDVVNAPVSASKRELILKFMDVFGTSKALTQNFDMLIQQAAQQKPTEAQKIKDRVKVDEIIEELLPVYDRNFSEEDLKAYIDFYGSPYGQKLIATIPLLMRGSIEASTRYIQRKFPELAN